MRRVVVTRNFTGAVLRWRAPTRQQLLNDANCVFVMYLIHIYHKQIFSYNQGQLFLTRNFSKLFFLEELNKFLKKINFRMILIFFSLVTKYWNFVQQFTHFDWDPPSGIVNICSNSGRATVPVSRWRFFFNNHYRIIRRGRLIGRQCFITGWEVTVATNL